MSRKKLWMIVLIIVCVITVSSAACIVFHQCCGSAHWAKHIHQGMMYEDVVNLLGEPIRLTSTGQCVRFDLDNGQSIVVTFCPQSETMEHLVVHSYYFADTAELE